MKFEAIAGIYVFCLGSASPLGVLSAGMLSRSPAVPLGLSSGCLSVRPSVTLGGLGASAVSGRKWKTTANSRIAQNRLFAIGDAQTTNNRLVVDIAQFENFIVRVFW